ncbi:hypothetical protein [Carnobacterium maltaromaticum]|uniref:hypothetical protein n=1 Tax=Carnobacterium maltaromaticum TaxID=2751 RepID=UPI00191BA149|nr:hypothetical protein [Carnobacterium maltaromaticum]CAD5897016.1 conserved hypothetical protein [Carnobacterium maltaromaticum]
MSIEKELQQIFKESYLEYLSQFLKEDEEYLLMRQKINFAENKVLKCPTKKNKEILKKNKFQIAEYVHINIFRKGFSEGVNYSQLESEDSLM